MLTYVTSNHGKYISVKEEFEKDNIDVNFYKYDFHEPDINNIEIVSKSKVLEAYNILKSPCFVKDSGFYIEDYPNNPMYPGAFVKRSGISTNIDLLLDTMKDVKNRNCFFLDCLTFYDGENFYTFYGKSTGTLSYQKRGNNMEKSQSNLWYVFIPKNSNKTLAEMNDYERNNRKDEHTSANYEFANWYKNVYLKDKRLILKK